MDDLDCSVVWCGVVWTCCCCCCCCCCCWWHDDDDDGHDGDGDSDDDSEDGDGDSDDGDDDDGDGDGDGDGGDDGDGDGDDDDDDDVGDDGDDGDDGDGDDFHNGDAAISLDISSSSRYKSTCKQKCVVRFYTQDNCSRKDTDSVPVQIWLCGVSGQGNMPLMTGVTKNAKDCWFSSFNIIKRMYFARNVAISQGHSLWFSISRW